MLRKLKSREKFDIFENVKKAKALIIEIPMIQRKIQERKFFFLAFRYFSLKD